MLVKLSLAAAGALMMVPSRARATETVKSRCVELSVPRGLPFRRQGCVGAARQQCRGLGVLYRRRQGLHDHARSSGAFDPDDEVAAAKINHEGSAI